MLAVIDCLVGGFQGQLELRRCLFGRPFLRALPAEELPYGQTATLKTELATPLVRTANEICIAPLRAQRGRGSAVLQ